MDKAKQTVLDFIWSTTHSDFKGSEANGERSIMVFRNGSTIVPMSALTDAEIASRMAWPKRADGTNKTMGEMPKAQQRAHMALALMRVRGEFAAAGVDVTLA